MLRDPPVTVTPRRQTMAPLARSGALLWKNLWLSVELHEKPQLPESPVLWNLSMDFSAEMVHSKRIIGHYLVLRLWAVM